MEWMRTLQKAIDYVEEHLLEEIRFDDVARHLNLSPYEFHRAFRFLSGMTLNTYIRNRRLSLAGQELSQSDKKIVDIALKYGLNHRTVLQRRLHVFTAQLPNMQRQPEHG